MPTARRTLRRRRVCTPTSWSKNRIVNSNPAPATVIQHPMDWKTWSMHHCASGVVLEDSEEVDGADAAPGGGAAAPIGNVAMDGITVSHARALPKNARGTHNRNASRVTSIAIK